MPRPPAPPRGIISIYAGRLRVRIGRLDLFARLGPSPPRPVNNRTKESPPRAGIAGIVVPLIGLLKGRSSRTTFALRYSRRLLGADPIFFCPGEIVADRGKAVLQFLN